jgi:signal transduction histidine kinase
MSADGEEKSGQGEGLQRAGLDHPDMEGVSSVQRALQERPSFSIRARLMLVFSFFFMFSAAAILAMWYSINRMEKGLHFLELADRFAIEVQQARRFEKNYLLYGTNREDILGHLEKAKALLISAADELSSVMGEGNFTSLMDDFSKYRALVLELFSIDRGEEGKLHLISEIEAKMRLHGSEMLSLAMRFAKKERSVVQATLKLMGMLPLGFLLILFALGIYSVNFLTRQILGPLNRIMATTRRIAQGDFTPHPPVRKYKDEFTDLALAINRMISEIKRQQETLVEFQKMRALGTLTAGVAHQLNNPLNNISTSCQILQEELQEGISPYHKELLASIEAEVTRSRDIVKALLEFSRVRDFELKEVDLRVVVMDTLRLIKGETPPQVRVDVEVPDGITIRADKSRLEQALMNIIINAIQALGDEGGTISIRARRDKVKGEVVLEIEDTGPGIPPEILPRIFEPFFTTKEVGKGDGLGLAIVYGIVERHGGRIQVRSEVGKGTCFILTLPSGSPEQEPTRPDPQPPQCHQ